MRLVPVRLKALVATALSAAVTLFAHAAHALDLPALTAAAGPSVVLLTVYGPTGAKEGTGTGFFVGAGGRILTNQHVIADASRVEATLPSGRTVAIAGIVVEDAARDLAIVQTAGEGTYPALGFATAAPRQGDEIVVLGSPHGLSGSLSVGIVAAVRDKHEGERGARFSSEHWLVQITAPISAGSSGSPVMNRAGEVVAVAVGMHVSGQNLNFAILGPTAKAVVDGVPTNVVPKPLRAGEVSPLKRNLLISAAVLAALGALAAIALRLEGRKPAPPTKPDKTKLLSS